MALSHSEDEQWQAIKTWWKANGKWTVAIILSAILVGFAIQYWQKAKVANANTASALYDVLLNNFQANKLPLFEQAAQQLQKDYSHTPYATIAALFQAEQAIKQANLALALQKLQWAMTQAPGSDLRQIARIRAARILVAQQQGDAALNLLAKVENTAFLPGINQVKGDIYLMQGRKAEARVAYQAALKELPAGGVSYFYLKMQVDQL